MPLRQSFDPFEYGEQLLEAQVNPLDPVDWAHKKAGIDLWSKQRDIIRSIRDNRRTAVQSGHGIGKSLTASVAASWWVDTHPADQTLVVTTAPSVKQVHAILWEEIRKIHSGGGPAR
jgi:reverse gyrase